MLSGFFLGSFLGIKNKKRAVKFINQYIYSSYEDYCDTEKGEDKILTKDEFPEYFSEIHNLKTYIYDWLTLKESVEN